MTTLTTDVLAVFKRPFALNDHEFLNGFVYLTEPAVGNRIEEIDPAWGFDIIRIYREGEFAVCAARLTILGVSRDCVGMQKINEKAGEPEKSAATDALKRGARLFGIGRYLLDAPKENAGFEKWLNDLSKWKDAQPVAFKDDRSRISGFVALMKERYGVTATEITQALGVSRFGEYGGDETSAEAAIKAWVNPPPPKVTEPSPVPDADQKTANGDGTLERLFGKKPAEQFPGELFLVDSILMQKERGANNFSYVLNTTAADGTVIHIYAGDVFRRAGLNPDAWKKAGHTERFDPALEVYAAREHGKWVVYTVVVPQAQDMPL